jgi:peptide/nickel transport system ATP-binding protein
METRFSDVEETAIEVFGLPPDVQADATPEEELRAALSTLPPAVREPLEEVVELVRDNDEGEALDRLLEEFGSECDARFPDTHEVSDTGRTSLCHLHQPEYDSPQERLGRRYDF